VSAIASGRPALRDVTAAPNLVSLARIALTPVVVALLASGHRAWAAGLLVLLFVTDGLDGYLARRQDRVTELGKVLDPAADKIAVAAVLIRLVVAGEFPLWALLLVLARDVAIAVGGVAVARRTGVVPPALMVGKVALVLLAVAVVVFAADIVMLEPPALSLAVAAVIISGAGYALAARRLLAGTAVTGT
jgi:CDP-diacylglycerol--glycerol-3-phosphate 3-phosphatidyltransferase